MRVLQSLSRGLRTLDLLREAGEPLRLTHIADELGVRKSNASHVLKTLVAAGWAIQDSTRRYAPAARCGGRHTLSDVVACKERCRPALESLVAATGECAHLAVLVEHRVWYVDKVESALPLKVDHPIGALSPLHCTALGKAFLAFGKAAIPPVLSRYTDRTIVERHLLARDVAATRARGFAIDNEEFAEGIRCVARPVYDIRGDMIAALGISGPSVRIDDRRLEELGALVRATVIVPEDNAP